MKRLKLILSTFVLALIASGTVYAQETQTFNANAEVLAAISTAEVDQLDFGIVADDFAAGNPSLDPSDGTATNVEGGTQQVGFVSVTGTASQTVDVTVASGFNLTETGGSGDVISYSPTYNWSPDNLTAGSTPTSPQLGSNTTANFSMALDADGQNTILIGGSLSESKSGALTAGTYQGSATLTIGYQ